MGKGVIRWGKPMWGYFVLSFPLILAGTISAAIGGVVFLLRPEGPVTDDRNKKGQKKLREKGKLLPLQPIGGKLWAPGYQMMLRPLTNKDSKKDS